jgi:pyridoxal phosphate enzyme (YggS family)
LNTYLNKFLQIKNNILSHGKEITIVVVTKSVNYDKIKDIIDYGHVHFGENRVQDANKKWIDIKKNFIDIKLHFIGKLQTNKADEAVSLFSYIHSLESEKLAISLSKAEKNHNKKIKYFIQINIGREQQKSGISIEDAPDFINFCIKSLDLDIVGLMCIPPVNQDPVKYFIDLKVISERYNLLDLSMGMSSDYIQAIKCGSTFVRIGSAIFNEN